MNAPVQYQLLLANTFQRALTSLAAKHQAEINDAILKLQRGHTSVHLHAIPPHPWVSFGSTRDALRVICHRQGDQLLLVHVDTHDAAYKWAKSHRPCNIGPAFRIVDVEESTEAPVEDTTLERPPGPLAAIRDKDFKHFGIDPHAAEGLRAIPTENALIAVLVHMEPHLGEALLGLASDPDDIDGIFARYQQALETGTAAAEEADFSASINSQDVWVPPPGESALAAALRGDLDTWKIFLHPSQRRLALFDGSGALKVTGGPGTGKSVVALHRARHLAEHVFADDDRPILLCTFSRALAVQLEDDFKALCVDAPHLCERVEVRTLTQAAKDVAAAGGHPSGLIVGDALEQAWVTALKDDTLDLHRAFYEAERELVVLAQRCRSDREYRRAKRRGRKKRLTGHDRVKVWPVLKTFDEELQRLGGSDTSGLAALAVQALEDGAPQPYAAVVCDEIQDVSGSELRMLAALTQNEDGKTGANRLFVVGDGHQRLYRRPVSLLSCGVDIRGRSFKLRLNYRTTQGICSAALASIEGIDLDEVDAAEGAETSLDALRGYRSIREGAPPERRRFASASEEADWIAELARDGTALLVVARRNSYLESLAELLRTRGHEPTLLGESLRVPKDAQLVLSTLHRSKGLESPRVVIAGIQDIPLRWPGKKAGEKHLWQRKEKSLLYVAMTRARDWCGVSEVGEPRSG